LGHYRTERGKLIDGVILWLRRMGLVDSVNTEETPKIGFRLTVNSPGLKMPLDLTSVGVGISQVLPTLVLSLLTPPDSVLIFEQPELHLHPKVQSVLGDFLLAISLMGKQCLVETHSEHLINRLRRRIVESHEETVLPRLRIYFAEKEGTVSHFHQVKPNEFGSIMDWPAGFFDEAENEAAIILNLQMEKKRSQIQKQKQRSQEETS
jgi:predicted ATPase